MVHAGLEKFLYSIWQCVRNKEHDRLVSFLETEERNFYRGKSAASSDVVHDYLHLKFPFSDGNKCSHDSAAICGFTLLHLAAAVGSLHSTSLLLERGCDPNVSDCQNRTPLYYAAESGYLTVCITLLEKGADINLLDCSVRRPFEYFPQGAFSAFASLLIDFSCSS